MDEKLKYYIENGQIEIKYSNIIEIYPRKFLSSYTLDSILLDLQKDYELVKVTNTWIRAFKK